jgi:hypothetical protein
MVASWQNSLEIVESPRRSIPAHSPVLDDWLSIFVPQLSLQISVPIFFQSFIIPRWSTLHLPYQIFYVLYDRHSRMARDTRPVHLTAASKQLFDIYMSKDTSLSYDVAHRTVRSWRQNLFDWFSRWPWNTLRNRMCVAGRSGRGSFQQYFYNRYKIVVYTGLRSYSIKNHASRYRHRWR